MLLIVSFSSDSPLLYKESKTIHKTCYNKAEICYNSKGIKDVPVFSINESSKGLLFIGTQAHGLYTLDPNTNKISEIRDKHGTPRATQYYYLTPTAKQERMGKGKHGKGKGWLKILNSKNLFKNI